MKEIRGVATGGGRRFAIVASRFNDLVVTRLVDGASEAIGIGVANAGLFTRVIGHSPALLITPFARGFPRILVTAGESDQVVTMTTTRDNVVVGLRNQGFTVDFFVFEGGHTIPSEVRERAFQLMAAD